MLMEEDISILIFEKDKSLKKILFEELNKVFIDIILVVENFDKLLSYLNKSTLNVLIVNYDDLCIDFNEFVKNTNLYNEDTKLIVYKNKTSTFKDIYTKDEIIFLTKPFKIKTLIHHISSIINHNNKKFLKAYLMEHLIFYPTQKLVKNLKSKKEEYFTETEVKLLSYLLDNKNNSIYKKKMLSDIWRYNINAQTHTIETHLYRLKQKLYSLEPNLPFSIINKNGKYHFKNFGDNK